METNEDKKCCETKKCNCVCHAITGVFIALIGIAILLAVFDVITPRTAWMIAGIVVVLIGLKTMCSGICKHCQKN
jgi:hypothetical protein